MKRLSEDAAFRALLIVLLAAALIAVAYVIATAQTPREPPQSIFVPCPDGWTKVQCDAWWKLQRQMNDRMEYPFEAIRALARDDWSKVGDTLMQSGRVFVNTIDADHAYDTVIMSVPYSSISDYFVFLQFANDTSAVEVFLTDPDGDEVEDTYMAEKLSASSFRFLSSTGVSLNRGYIFWLTVGK